MLRIWCQNEDTVLLNVSYIKHVIFRKKEYDSHLVHFYLISDPHEMEVIVSYDERSRIEKLLALVQ